MIILFASFLPQKPGTWKTPAPDGIDPSPYTPNDAVKSHGTEGVFKGPTPKARSPPRAPRSPDADVPFSASLTGYDILGNPLGFCFPAGGTAGTHYITGVVEGAIFLVVIGGLMWLWLVCWNCCSCMCWKQGKKVRGPVSRLLW